MNRPMLNRFQGNQEDSAPLVAPPSLLGLRQKRKKKNTRTPTPPVTGQEEEGLLTRPMMNQNNFKDNRRLTRPFGGR